MIDLSSISISARFGTTLFTNILRAGLSFLSALIIARGLGPADFGNMSFLLGTFVAIHSFIDMGSSSAFYTFISQRRRSKHFLRIYFCWVGMQLLAELLLVGLLVPNAVLQKVWIGQDRAILLLALVASFLMNNVWAVVSQLGESIRRTQRVQLAWTLQAMTHLMLTFILWRFGLLSVRTVFGITILQYVVLVLWLGRGFYVDHVADKDAKDAIDNISTVLKEFSEYCFPLLLSSAVGFLYMFGDRWMLQAFGGSIEQGYFSIAQQFTSISLVATTSILQVFWKEIAEAQHTGDQEKAYALYRCISRRLYFVAATVSCLLIPYSHDIALKLLGVAYEEAWPTLALLFLFPIHQSLGQIGGTFFCATGRTRPFAVLSAGIMMVSLPVTYLMVADPKQLVPGLGLGSVGLAIKFVVIQVVSVNLQAVLIARLNGWKWDWSYQAIGPSFLILLGMSARWITDETLSFIGLGSHLLSSLLVASAIYVLGICMILYFMPWLIDLTRDEISGIRIPFKLKSAVVGL